MNPLVLSNIYECSIAPKVHILLARPWGFPICSSLKITPLVKISYKTQKCYSRQNLSTLTTTLCEFVGEVHLAGAGFCLVFDYEFVSIQKTTVNQAVQFSFQKLPMIIKRCSKRQI